MNIFPQIWKEFISDSYEFCTDIGVWMGGNVEEIPRWPCRYVVAFKPCSSFSIQVHLISFVTMLWLSICLNKICDFSNATVTKFLTIQISSLLFVFSYLHSWLFLRQGTSRKGTKNKRLHKDEVFPYIYGCKLCILRSPRLSIPNFDLLLVGLLGVST